MGNKKLLTHHPYIIKKQGIQGAQPCVKGTRITVAALWNYYDVHGLSPREISAQFPQLTLAVIFDALSYASENMTEIENILKSEYQEIPEIL